MKPLCVTYAESEPLSYYGLKALLGEGGGIERIDHCATSSELHESLNSHSCDLLIIDYNQGSFHQDDLFKIRKEHPDLHILIISSDDNSHSIIRALELGIDGYLTRQCDRDEIINAIFAISKGEKFYCNKIVDVLLERSLSPKREDDCAPTNLSARESEITQLIAKGLTTPQIAEQLFLSKHTVSTHRKNILKKLGIGSVPALINYAHKVGLVRDDSEN